MYTIIRKMDFMMAKVPHPHPPPCICPNTLYNMYPFNFGNFVWYMEAS
jgi:hypothetical protein